MKRPCQYLYDLLIGLATAPENQQILACISPVREEERARARLFVLVSRLARNNPRFTEICWKYDSLGARYTGYRNIISSFDSN